MSDMTPAEPNNNTSVAPGEPARRESPDAPLKAVHPNNKTTPFIEAES